MAALGFTSSFGVEQRLTQENSSPASVSTSGSNDGQPLAAVASLARIATHEEILEKVAKKLEGYIFEGVCRSVKELEDVLMGVDLLQRCNVGMSKGSIRGFYESGEIGAWDLGRVDKQRIDLERKLLKRKIRPVFSPVIWQPRQLGRDKETAIWCEAG
jgi:hypothetical protein